MYFAVFLLLFTAVAGAQSTTSTNSNSSYCSDLFNNSVNGQPIVTNVFAQSASANGGSQSSTLLISGVTGLAALIVLMILLLLAILYGIGTAFGINKLIEFVKSEYIESFFTLLMVVIIASGLATINGFANFFTNLANFGGTSQSSSSGGTGVLGLYTNICNNILSGQVWPILGIFVGSLIVQPLYDVAQNLAISVNSGTTVSNYLPSFSFTPLGGLALFYQLLLFEESPVFVIVFMGVGTIFLFYVIYFLFPIFLYMGVLLRSFPWTRAAGGSFLALFIAFYIVFPALYYPFSAFAIAPSISSQSSNAGTFVCNYENATNMAALNSTGAGTFTTGTGCIQGSSSTSTSVLAYLGSNILTKLNAFFQAVFSNFSGGGQTFITNLDLYVEVVALAVGKLIGLAISFIIAFDLLEALGDLLGSPSLTSGRLFERLI